MADKEKKVANDSEVDKATTEESKAAEKVAKAAKGKKDKAGVTTRANKGAKRFFKDFKGECKKIVWPDARTILKSTGVVLLVVLIVTVAVFVIDFGLERGISGLKGVARSQTDAVATATDAIETTAEEAEEAEAEETTEAEAEEETEAEAEEETEAEETQAEATEE